MRILQKKDNLSYWPEVSLSTAVIIALLEVIHFVIFSSEKFIVINSSVLFGSLGDNSASLFVSILFLILLVLLFTRKFFGSVPFMLIFSGATVNILDRIFYGGSLDYFRVLGIPYFNLSDICIVLGVAIFIAQAFKKVK